MNIVKAIVAGALVLLSFPGYADRETLGRVEILERVKKMSEELKRLGENLGGEKNNGTLGESVKSIFVKRNFGEKPGVVYYVGKYGELMFDMVILMSSCELDLSNEERAKLLGLPKNIHCFSSKQVDGMLDRSEFNREMASKKCYEWHGIYGAKLMFEEYDEKKLDEPATAFFYECTESE